MLEQWMAGQQIISGQLLPAGGQIIFYILAVEVLILCVLQTGTNRLLKKSLRIQDQKKERLQQMKEEVKNGTSDIPVVKFESPKKVEKSEKKEEELREAKQGFDQKEVAVLQELLAEYFG